MWLALVLCVDWADLGTVVRLPLVVNDGADEVTIVLWPALVVLVRPDDVGIVVWLALET